MYQINPHSLLNQLGVIFMPLTSHIQCPWTSHYVWILFHCQAEQLRLASVVLKSRNTAYNHSSFYWWKQVQRLIFTQSVSHKNPQSYNLNPNLILEFRTMTMIYVSCNYNKVTKQKLKKTPVIIASKILNTYG